MMKLSNFILLNKTGVYIVSYNATVDVTTTTGFLWWQKEETVTRKISKGLASGFLWFFIDDGEYVPYSEINKLTRMWGSKTGEYC